MVELAPTHTAGEDPGDRRNPSSARATADEVLRVEAVSKRLDGQLVLDNLSLQLRAGENLAILGKSGSGKSVFLKIITGLMKPDEGQIYLWGQPMGAASERKWNRCRRRLGMVFQSGALFDSMTVGDNVAFPLRERMTSPEWTEAEDIESVIAERLEWVGLGGTQTRYPSELSGGMRRRVALARTLAGNPEFVLYDEPTAGLDPVTGRRIAKLMRDLDKKLNSTSVLVTHDIYCARTVSKTWAFLSAGKVLMQGTPAELQASSEPEIRDFLTEQDD